MPQKLSEPFLYPAATSSYVSVVDDTLYSAGGHFAEAHEIEKDGSIGAKLQQFEYLPRDQMAGADTTRKALVSFCLPIYAIVHWFTEGRHTWIRPRYQR